MANLRRFYFDDGKSRKRWHVLTKGKSQIVSYGRIGGALRELKKTFKSPSDVSTQTEKLIAKKKREGYIEINPSRLEIVRKKGRRKATEKQIAVLEKQIGSTLPDEYRNFLKLCNGGRPNPDCVAVPGVKGIDNVGVGVLFHLQPSKPGVHELSSEFEKCSGSLLPVGHLPIAGDSDVYTLSLAPKTFGAIYWWFHETDELDEDGNFLKSAGHLLASSFDEFLTRIALLYGDDEGDFEEPEVAPSPSPKSRSPKKKPKATIKRLLRLVNHELTPAKIKEVEQTVKDLGDLSGIENGTWPFTNIRSPRIIDCLLKARLNPEITDTDRHSLLWQCASNRECIDLLAKKGVKIDRRSGNDHETALMRAIFLEEFAAVKRLLKLGANPTVRLSWPIGNKLKTNNKLRKLIESARVEWRKSKKSPATANAKSNAATPKKKGLNPTIHRLLRLMKHDHITDQCNEVDEIVELIAELGDISEIQNGKWPQIDKFESPRLLKRLLDAGLNPEITDKGGGSLLCQCVVHPDCIALLIKAGVDVDRRSGKHNGTALMRATWKGEKDCVQRLLKAGADPTLEFDALSKVMMGMDDEMTMLIEAACKRRKRRKK